MILKVQDFCNYVSGNLNGFINTLASISRNVSDREKNAWKRSFPAVSVVLRKAMDNNRSIGEAHIFSSHLFLEYQLPSASAWCDLVLIGKNETRNNQVLIVELKDWERNSVDSPGRLEGLIMHNGIEMQHPSDQVKGYTEYCRRFHSTIYEYRANVSGCVFFTQALDKKPYNSQPNSSLTTEFPVFNPDDNNELADYISDVIEGPDEKFANDFVKGYYMQDKNILTQVAKSFASTKNSPFVLLDEQRKGFNQIKASLSSRISDQKKQVIIVEGPPGSGKSALAANIWFHSAINYLNTRKGKSHNIVFVTTSSSQRTNWEHTFKTYGENYNAGNLVIPANKFNPGVTSHKIPELKEHFFLIDPLKYKVNGNTLNRAHWKEYISYVEKESGQLKYFPNQHFISVVDEAHALIDPTLDNYKSNKHAGWVQQAGPHAYHIINASQVTIFFTDSKQSYRDNETTTTEAIISFANELGADVDFVNLEDMQFRCGGSKEYVEWVEGLFQEEPHLNAKQWRDKISVKIADSPFELDNLLKEQHQRGNTIRLLSSYSRKWVTKSENTPHNLPKHKKDFFLVFHQNGSTKEYAKIWNYAPSEDYTLFVMAPEGSEMNKDPLSEVGCPYVVRGFDYDYIGLLWLDDLVYRNGRWEIKLNNVSETALSSTLADAKSTGNSDKLLHKIIQGYRILLTRSIKGTFIYCHDKETSEFLKKMLH